MLQRWGRKVNLVILGGGHSGRKVPSNIAAAKEIADGKGIDTKTEAEILEFAQTLELEGETGEDEKKGAEILRRLLSFEELPPVQAMLDLESTSGSQVLHDETNIRRRGKRGAALRILQLLASTGLSHVPTLAPKRNPQYSSQVSAEAKSKLSLASLCSRLLATRNLLVSNCVFHTEVAAVHLSSLRLTANFRFALSPSGKADGAGGSGVGSGVGGGDGGVDRGCCGEGGGGEGGGGEGGGGVGGDASGGGESGRGESGGERVVDAVGGGDGVAAGGAAGAEELLSGGSRCSQCGAAGLTMRECQVCFRSFCFGCVPRSSQHCSGSGRGGANGDGVINPSSKSAGGPLLQDVAHPQLSCVHEGVPVYVLLTHAGSDEQLFPGRIAESKDYDSGYFQVCVRTRELPSPWSLKDVAYAGFSATVQPVDDLGEWIFGEDERLATQLIITCTFQDYMHYWCKGCDEADARRTLGGELLERAALPTVGNQKRMQLLQQARQELRDALEKDEESIEHRLRVAEARDRVRQLEEELPEETAPAGVLGGKGTGDANDADNDVRADCNEQDLTGPLSLGYDGDALGEQEVILNST